MRSYFTYQVSRRVSQVTFGFLALLTVAPASAEPPRDADTRTPVESSQSTSQQPGAKASENSDDRDQQAAPLPTLQPPPSLGRPREGPHQYCKALEAAALAHGLPPDFFVRLIWQESNFNPNSVSRAGAQGIAQFMPGSARWRGLANPFEPLPALQESARWLGELHTQFGNLGLAAAAYNAGPGRVQDWLAGRGNLPGETRAYVKIITGRPAEDWASGTIEDRVQSEKPMACDDIARGLFAKAQPAVPRGTADIAEQAAWGPWGLQLAGGPSRSRVVSDFEHLQKRFAAVLGDRRPLVLRTRMAGPGSATWYLVRVAESTRERARQLCARLEAIGGRCLVYRN